MKFSLVDGQRREAEPELRGECPACGQATIAKCGQVKVRHWAHKGRLTCDPWWENETEWHRAWKGNFPEDWQEIVQRADDGEKHVADVKTDQGWVIEFQHSHLKPEERQARDAFYSPKFVWVVDGTRRKRDFKQFIEVIKSGRPVSSAFSLISRQLLNGCAVLNDWVDSQSFVFF
jgi:competence protein CoiA